MRSKTYEERLERLLHMIKKDRISSQAQAAQLFSCSSRTIRRMMADLKNSNQMIRYSKALNIFYIKDKPSVQATLASNP